MLEYYASFSGLYGKRSRISLVQSECWQKKPSEHFIIYHAKVSRHLGIYIYFLMGNIIPMSFGRGGGNS
jgi:hypothetical protein